MCSIVSMNGNVVNEWAARSDDDVEGVLWIMSANSDIIDDDS